MIVWILLVRVLIATPHGENPMPYLAFNTQKECVAAMQALPEGYQSDCIPFAADVTK